MEAKIEETQGQKPLGKMTKDELIAYAEQLMAQNAGLQDELNTLKGEDTAGRKLNYEKAERIRAAVLAGESKNVLARRYGVSRDTIRAVVTGQIYKFVDPEAEAKKAAEKAAKAAAREEAKAARKAAIEAKAAETLANRAAAAEARKAKAAEKAAAKEAAAKAADDGTGPVKGAKKGPKSKAVGTPVATEDPAVAAAKSAELRRLAFQKAQERVAAKQAAAEAGPAPTVFDPGAAPVADSDVAPTGSEE